MDEEEIPPTWLGLVLRVECPHCHRLFKFWTETSNTFRNGETIYTHTACGSVLPRGFAHYPHLDVIVCTLCDSSKLQYAPNWHASGKSYARDSSFITIVGEELCDRH